MMTIDVRAFAASSILLLVAVTANPRVKIANGELEGHVKEGAHAFEGIPFAEKPGRLEYPVKKQNWKDVLEVKRQPPRCWQKLQYGGETSEDCLYLTVVAPSNKEQKLPVVVVVHGGAFSGGGLFETNVDHVAKHMVSKGVVVVAIQYRVGALGFCTTGDSVIPGNYGAYDVKMALEWVRDNIGAFGGNPEDITTYGVSAGAAMVDALLLNEETSKLFHKIIMVSGAARDLFKQDIKGSCKKFLESKGLDASTPQKMRESIITEGNATKIETGFQDFFEDSISNFKLDWSPVIDGKLFKDNIKELRGKAPKKPMIVGLTDLEGAGFTTKFANPKDVLTWRENMRHILEWMIPQIDDRYNVEQALLKEYDDFGNNRVNDTDDRNKAMASKVAFDKAFGEYIMGSVVYDEVEYFLKKNGDDPKAPIYLFNFKRYNEAFTRNAVPFIDMRGAYHSMDQWYSINNDQRMKFADAADAYTRDLYTNIIVNFAKTGDPNGNGPTKLPVQWNKLTKEHPDRNYVIDDPAKVEDDYFNGRLRRIRDWAIKWGRITPM